MSEEFLLELHNMTKVSKLTSAQFHSISFKHSIPAPYLATLKQYMYASLRFTCYVCYFAEAFRSFIECFLLSSINIKVPCRFVPHQLTVQVRILLQ